MKRILGLFSLLVAVIILAAMADTTLAQSYRKYCNGRFGFCVEYPDNFGMEPAPTYINYPSRMKAEYESLVTRISRSFSPGGLGDAH